MFISATVCDFKLPNRKNMIQKIRDSLDRNKVIFETVAAFLLSLMAVIVSIAQTLTTSKQTELLALQTRIAEAQALPQFEVAIHQKRNNTNGNFDDDILVVANHGGPIHDFEASSAFFLSIEAEIPGVGYRKAEIPLNGYFSMQGVSVAGTGDLVTMYGDRNNAKIGELRRGVMQATNTRKWPYALIGERIAVRLRYRDLLDRQHEDYYDVRPVSGGTRILDVTGKEVFAKWDGAFPRVELLTLDVEKLLAIISNSSAM